MYKGAVMPFKAQVLTGAQCGAILAQLRDTAVGAGSTHALVFCDSQGHCVAEVVSPSREPLAAFSEASIGERHVIGMLSLGHVDDMRKALELLDVYPLGR